MAVDLFGSNTSTTPKGVDLFADEPAVDLFAGEAKKPVVRETPEGEPGATIDLSTGAPVIIPNEAAQGESTAPVRVVERMGAAAAQLAFDLEKMIKERSNKRGMPENVQRVAELDRAIAETQATLEEIHKQDPTKAAGLVGGALESVIPSSLGLVAAATPMSVPATVAVGLGGNLVAETTGAYGERRRMGQTSDEAMPGATAEGVVSTALELGPLSMAGKLLKGKVKATLPYLTKFGLSEAGQEAGTQAFSDVLRNVEGIQDLSAGDIFQNSLEAGATGALMLPIMAPFGATVRYGHLRAMAKAQDQAFVDTLQQASGDALTPEMQQEARALAAELRVNTQGTPLEQVLGIAPTADEVTTLKPVGEVTDAERQTAEMQRALQETHIDVPATPEGEALKAQLQKRLEQMAGAVPTAATPHPDLGGPSEDVQTRIARLQSAAGRVGQNMVVASTDDRIIGLNVEQLPEQPKGSVIAIADRGLDVGYHFPQDVAQATVTALKKFVDKFAPDMRVVLDLQRLGDYGITHQGMATLAFDQKANPFYVITPRDLPSFQQKYQGGNVTSRMEFLGVLAHEFGHVLKIHTFQQGMKGKGVSDELVNRVMSEAAAGSMNPATVTELAQLAPTEAALMAEWMDLRTRVLDGTMPAKEFADRWLGSRKVAWGIAAEQGTKQPPYAWAEQRLGMSIARATAKQLVETFGTLEEALTFDEFMAEQTSRYMTAKGEFEKTPFAKVFGDIVSKLKQLFVDLKKEGIVPTGTAFETWMQERSVFAKTQKKTKGVWEKKSLTKILEAKAKEQAEDAAEEEPEDVTGRPAQTNAPIDIVETIEEQAAEIDSQETLQEQLDSLVDFGAIGREDVEYRKIAGAIKRGQFEKARELMDDLGFSSYDLDTEIPLGDKFYTSRLLLRVPEGDWMKAVDLRNILQYTPGLRQQDVKAAKDALMAAKGTGGQVDLQKLQAAILNMNVPLTVEVAQGKTSLGHTAYNDYGANSLGIPSESTYTLIFKAPFDISTNNHFKDAKYVFHARVALLGNLVIVMEVQSDLVRNAKSPVVSLQDVDKQAIYTQSILRDVQFYKNQLEKMLVAVPDANGLYRVPGSGMLAYTKAEFDSYFASRKELYARSQANLQKAQQQLATMREIQREGEGRRETTLSALRKDDWLERGVREIVAWAGGRKGTSMEGTQAEKILFVKGEAAATIEGWARAEDGSYGPNQKSYNYYERKIPEILNQVYRENGDVVADVIGIGGANYTALSAPLFPQMITLWDQNNPATSTVDGMNQALKGLIPRALAKANYYAAKARDQFVQLQYRAKKQLPGGGTNKSLERYMKLTGRISQWKNRLQFGGEQFVTELDRQSKTVQDKLQALLHDEWKSGVLSVNLTPLISGRLMANGQENPAAQPVDTTQPGWRDQAVGWRYEPSALTIQLFKNHGIDPNEGEGAKIAEMFLTYKNLVLDHFVELERVLQDKILARYAKAPLVAKVEMAKLDEVMSKLRGTPFMPQMRFGNFVITTMVKKDKVKPGQKAYKVVRREHFEDVGHYKEALALAMKVASNSKGKMVVEGKEVEQYLGIPLQLPKGLLDTVKDTGMFTDDQVDVLEELMSPGGYNKISQRYVGMNGELAGANQDFLRNYAHFMWHNANFIWKMKFRQDFQKVINSQHAEIRQNWRRQDLDVKVKQERAVELERNLKYMQDTTAYLLHPPQEFQTAKLYTTLAYLAWVPKTALMNFSTMLNTYAYMTSEYGEVEGHKQLLKGTYDAARVFKLRAALKEGKPLDRHENELLWAVDTAISEGVLDQSYAYMLAGVANTPSFNMMANKLPISKYGRMAVNGGMWLFRAVEHTNRYVTFLSFFNAERARGTALEDAFARAVERTNGMQNNYNPENRANILRGRKSILFVFMSYPIFMHYHMSGEVSRGIKGEIGEYKSILAKSGIGPTAKLWLIYLLLGGALGVPYAENLMDVLQWIWRTFFGTENLQVELRKFIKELGMSPDTVLHGQLHDFGGFDLSRSFGLGHMLPGTELLNRDWSNPGEALGAGMLKGAGPFGGFTEDLVKMTGAGIGWMHGRKRFAEVISEMPGVMGNLGKVWDAAEMQGRRPGYGVMSRTGVPMTMEGGKPRDLSVYELTGMATGATPALLSKNREFYHVAIGENIYWNAKRTSLLKHRNEAIDQRDDAKLKQAEADITKFNAEIKGTEYKGFRITGKSKADSLRTHRKAVQSVTKYGATTKAGKTLGRELKDVFED